MKVAQIYFKQSLFLTVLFLILLATYGFSSPWPKDVAFLEVLTGISLVFIFLRKYVDFILDFKIRIEGVFFIYGITILLFLGVINNELNDVVRDLIPFFYLYIGFLTFRGRDLQFMWYLCGFLMLLGLIYSFRSLFHWSDDIHLIGKSFLMSPDYIAQSPSLTFSSSLLLTIAIYLISTYKHKMVAIFILFLSIIPIIVLLAQILRAPPALILLFMFLFIIRISFGLRFKALMLLICVALFSLFLISDVLVGTIQLLIEKNNAVGTSGKLDEYHYAFDYMSSNLFSFIFGNGFGALWVTPFDDKPYSFAHSILVYFFIKGGLIGVLFMLAIVYRVLYMNIALIFSKNIQLSIIGFSAMPTLLINLFLEPGFKTLSFGMLLLIINIAYRNRKHAPEIIKI